MCKCDHLLPCGVVTEQRTLDIQVGCVCKMDRKVKKGRWGSQREAYWHLESSMEPVGRKGVETNQCWTGGQVREGNCNNWGDKNHSSPMTKSRSEGLCVLHLKTVKKGRFPTIQSQE